MWGTVRSERVGVQMSYGQCLLFEKFDLSKKNKFVTPGVLCTTDSSMTDCVCNYWTYGYSLLTHIVSHATVGYTEDTRG